MAALEHIRRDADALSLRTNGFWVGRDLLPAAMVDELRTWSERWLDAQDAGHFERFRHHGSMLAVDYREEIVRRLVSWPQTLEALRMLGFPRPKWLSGYLISKPARSPSLWWHQDWWAWDVPDSFGAPPPQLFVMYYLTDVDESNGCLRVLPGTHRRAHLLHGALPEAHGTHIGRTDEALAHGHQPGEVSVCVRAGDAVIGDVRLLHATHANRSAARRSCITLWYLPVFDEMSESLRAYVMQHPAQPPRGWWRGGDDPAAFELRHLLPVYEGAAQPATFNRTPPADWPR